MAVLTRSQRAVLCACVCSSTLLSAQTPAGRAVTVDTLMGLRTIVDAKISPAGDRVAYVVSTPSVERNAHECAVYVIPIAGGTPQPVAPGVRIFTPSLPAPRLRWRPDGSGITFLAVEGSRPQLLGVDLPSAAPPAPPRPLTAAPEGVFAYEWSHDGTRLAFLTREPGGPPSAATRVGALPPATRLWVQAIGTGAAPARPLTPADRFVDSFTWSPDGAEIVYSAAPVTGFLAPYSTRLFAVPSTGGIARAIVDRGGMNTQPQFSPDGRFVSFNTTDGRTDIIAPRGLAVAPAAGGAADIKRFPMNGAWISEVVWARDSRALFVTMNEGTFATGKGMFEMPVVRVPLSGETPHRVGNRPTVDYQLSISRDGGTLVRRAVEARTMGDLVVRDLTTGAERTITDVNPELKSFDLGTLEAISWKSFDGMEIWGLLLTPPRQTPGRRVPLLVYSHGGPIGGVTLGLFPQFMHVPGQIDPYPVEAFASAGFAVLFPMPRGGSGYGEAGHRMIVNDWGGPDFKDIMAGVDHVIATGVADPDRMGAMGASYGGFMTNWIVTHTDRFKAASAGASISDLADLYYLTEGGDLMVEYFKKPWENPDGYAAHSPMTFADRVRTPLLLQHGERDPRVPLASAHKFHRALQVRGKTVELDVYSGGGHVLYQPAQERHQMQRNFDWFTRWIKPD
jgi:dipeptidyl aminopeptidase/acylaminoacyl peptidase